MIRSNCPSPELFGFQAMPQEALADANLSLSLDQSKENIKAQLKAERSQAVLTFQCDPNWQPQSHQGMQAEFDMTVIHMIHKFIVNSAKIQLSELL